MELAEAAEKEWNKRQAEKKRNKLLIALVQQTQIATAAAAAKKEWNRLLIALTQIATAEAKKESDAAVVAVEDDEKNADDGEVDRNVPLYQNPPLLHHEVAEEQGLAGVEAQEQECMPAPLYAYITNTFGPVQLNFLTRKKLSHSDVHRRLSLYMEIPFNQEEMGRLAKKIFKINVILSPSLITVDDVVMRKWFRNREPYYVVKIRSWRDVSNGIKEGTCVRIWYFRDNASTMFFVIHNVA